MSALIAKFKEIMQPQDVLVSDGGFSLEEILTHGIPRFVAKQARNLTARRAQPPEYAGKGRPAERGVLVRPLARAYKGRRIPATPPDRSETWEEKGVTVRADIWDNLVLKNAKPDAPTFSVIAFHDPNFINPLLVATSLTSRPAMCAYSIWTVASRATPLGRQANDRRPPRFRLRGGNLPASA